MRSGRDGVRRGKRSRIFATSVSFPSSPIPPLRQRSLSNRCLRSRLPAAWGATVIQPLGQRQRNSESSGFSSDSTSSNVGSSERECSVCRGSTSTVPGTDLAGTAGEASFDHFLISLEGNSCKRLSTSCNDCAYLSVFRVRGRTRSRGNALSTSTLTLTIRLGHR